MSSMLASKSQKKREAKAIEALAHELVLLPDSRLKQAPLDEDVREEVLLARKITEHGAKKRQTKMVGKLLRERDARPIEDFLQNLRRTGFEGTGAFHELEMLRSTLLRAETHDDALQEVMERFPELDQSFIVALTVQHQVSGKKKYSRELFRVLKAAYEREQWKVKQQSALGGADVDVTKKIDT